MAEIKFNFYNTYNNYYRNINDIKICNIYIKPLYESIIEGEFEMETLSKFHKITLSAYVEYELRVKYKIDYIVYKSLKKINRQKILVKTLYKPIWYNCKIYNLFKI